MFYSAERITHFKSDDSENYATGLSNDFEFERRFKDYGVSPVRSIVNFPPGMNSCKMRSLILKIYGNVDLLPHIGEDRVYDHFQVRKLHN